MKKSEKNNRHKTSTSSPLPFEKFRKKASVNAILSNAAARAAKTSMQSIKKVEQAKHKQSKQTERKRLHESEVPQERVESNMRLNKFLAHAGVASRRKADEFIKAGRVTVNGKVITEMGFRLQKGDKVCFDGKLLTAEPKVYVLLNKPKDYITTVEDERNRKTVMDLVKGVNERLKHRKKVRLYPVGRLDRNTTGVLLLTNDGEMAQRLMHPSSEIKKVYHVFLDKKLKPSDFEKIASGGVVLEDGIAEVDVIAMPNPKNKAEVGIEIHSGKNRIVRRIFEALGYEVVKLDRVSFAGLTKKDLPRGRWRYLTEEEIRMLRYFTKGVVKHLPNSGNNASDNS
jgi:23S rRNA pseudouridine2605 synthase